MGSLGVLRVKPLSTIVTNMANRFLASPEINRIYSAAKDALIYRPVDRLARFETGNALMDMAGQVIKFFNDDYAIGLTRTKAQLRASTFGSSQHQEALALLLRSCHASAIDVAYADMLAHNGINPGLAFYLTDAPSALSPQRGYSIAHSLLSGRPDPDVVAAITQDLRQVSKFSYLIDPNLICQHAFDGLGKDILEVIETNNDSQMPHLPLTTPTSVELMKIMTYIRSLKDELITALIFDQSLVDLIDGHKDDLARIGMTPEDVKGPCTASCSQMATLTRQQILRKWPNIDCREGLYPIHAALELHFGEFFIIFDSALGQVSAVNRFQDVWEKAGTGNSLVHKEFKDAVDSGDLAKVHNFLANHPMRDYYFYQPAKDGYAPVYTLNVGDIYKTLYVATRETKHLDSALELFQQAAAMHPELAESHSAISQIERELYRQTKDPNHILRAIAQSQEAVSLNHYDPSAYYHLGLAYLEIARQTENAEAIKLAQRAFISAGHRDPDLIPKCESFFTTDPHSAQMVLSPSFLKRDTAIELEETIVQKRARRLNETIKTSLPKARLPEPKRTVSQAG